MSRARRAKAIATAVQLEKRVEIVAREPAEMTRRTWLLAAIPALVVVVLTWWGIDFGQHWDEDHNKINAVSFSIQNAFTLLPDSYTYPGVNYWLTLGAFSPELIEEFMGPKRDLAQF